jgi:thiamine biosynthesis lipoprotein ApbE
MALDAMARVLGERGAVAWFLDFGGSSQLAHGRPEGASDWKVLIAGEGQGAVRGILRLRGASLSTSRALPAGDPAGAIVDTRSGKPVPPPRLATVLATDATTAEAWSKALVVFGRDGIEPARAAGVEAIYEDAAGVIVTPNFPLERAGADD